MKSAACIVAVDVGNTAVKLGVRQGDDIVDHSIVLNQSSWQASVIEWVHERLGCQDVQWRIASVHRRAAERLVDAVKAATPNASLELVTFRDVPMPTSVEHPERLGIDRLLSAYAARRRWNSPLIVVDAGSAVTVDWVDQDGVLCGGAILPGLELQARALATGTDALPKIDWSSPHVVQLPARNTAEAIHGGILVGVAAAIDGLTQRYLENCDGEPESVQLVLTGGDAQALSAHVRHPHHRQANLVCRGLLDLPRS